MLPLCLKGRTKHNSLITWVQFATSVVPFTISLAGTHNATNRGNGSQLAVAVAVQCLVSTNTP